MKKIIILVIALALLMTACGKKPAQTNSAEPTAPSPTAEISAPQATETPTEPQKEVKASEATEDDFRISSDDDSTCTIIGCFSKASVIEVPDTIAGKTVVGIGTNAFSLSPAEKIILPDSVKYIETYAFNSCDYLQEVVFGSGLKEIGSAFILCPELQTAVFPEGLVKITDTLFVACDKLEEVFIPASAVEIGNPFRYEYESPNLVIVTPAGSTAEAVAIEAGIPVRNS